MPHNPFDQLETTITRRIIWRMLLLGSFVEILIFLFLVPIDKQSVKNEAIQEANRISRSVARVLYPVHKSKEVDNQNDILHNMLYRKEIQHAYIADLNGVILHSSDKTLLGQKTTTVFGVLESPTHINIVKKIPLQKDKNGTIFISLKKNVLYSKYQHFYFELGIALFFIIIILVLFIMWISKHMVSVRLWRLAKTMEKVEHGMFLVRARVDKLDEIGFVSLGLNKLLATITQLQARNIEKEYDLQDAHEQLSIKTQIERIAEELKQSNTKLQKRVSAQELLMEASHHLGEISNVEEVIKRLVHLIQEKLKLLDFAIFLSDLKKNPPSLKLAIASGIANIDLITNLTFQFGEGITGLAAQSKKPIAIHDISKDSRLKVWKELSQSAQPGIPPFLQRGSLLSTPMIYQKKVFGVMDFFYTKQNAFREDDIELFYALGALAAMAIANAKLYEETLQLATEDPLTKTLNRRAMERLIEREIARSQRFQTPVSLLMIDVDHFKLFNDRMGHLLGDQALQQVAETIQHAVRKVDSVARFGGEEFCVILPQTPMEAAQEVANKLAERIHQIDLPGKEQQPFGFISVSIGVSSFPDQTAQHPKDDETRKLIHAADLALYEAKRQGRNQVITYSQYKELL